MAFDALSAAKAYHQQLKLQQNLGDTSTPQETGDSFAKLVQDGLQSAVDAQKNAETLQIESITSGKVDLADLVTAISNAELTLNTVVAVRDKVIGAYQDIIRMPI